MMIYSASGIEGQHLFLFYFSFSFFSASNALYFVFFLFPFFFFGALPYRRVDSIEPIGDDRFTIESMFIDDDDDDVPQPISISPFSSSSSYFYPFFRHFFPANHRRPPSGVFCSFFSFFFVNFTSRSRCGPLRPLDSNKK